MYYCVFEYPCEYSNNDNSLIDDNMYIRQGNELLIQSRPRTRSTAGSKKIALKSGRLLY